MLEITLNQHINLASLGQWLSNDTVIFKLTKAASFDPGVEGIAISALQNIIQSGGLIRVKCAFQPFDEDGRPQGLFDGLFGIHLLFSAERATVSSDNENIRASLVKKMWSYIREHKGQIGDGKKQTIIFRDPDYSIPECLQESIAARFPYPNNFETLLTRMSEKLAGSGGLSTLGAEQSITSFLYEAAFNAHEHARSNSESNRLPTAIRGISLEKLVFNSPDELKRRETLTPALREYLERAWSSGRRQKTFLAATVADVGAGIHNTLPPTPNESAWDRLNRAFQSGVTRQPKSADKKLGEGLPNVLKAAAHLSAYLLVNSADLIGIHDFTIQQPATSNDVLTRHNITLKKRTGTSLTVIWPVTLGRGSQGQLFSAL